MLREKEVYQKRLIYVFLTFTTIFFFLFCRLAYLQVFKKLFFKELADSQHKVLLTLYPKRGNIYDRNMNLLAYNIDTLSIYATPKGLTPKEKRYIAQRLAEYLHLDVKELYNLLAKKRSFVWVKRKVDEDLAKKLESMHLKGIGFIEESKRCYPNGELASHILGFAGIDNRGLEGVELYYDSYLKGKEGFRLTLRDAKQRPLISKQQRYLAPVDGHNLILTIDLVIQHIAEHYLDEAFLKTKAKGAVIIVMDPNNGQVLALANRPTYDLNLYSQVDPDVRRNRAISDIFEPGSAFKIVTASCALELGVVDFDDTFFCEMGRYRVSGRILHDHKPHGKLTFRQIIEVSSNIGTVKVASLLEDEMFWRFIRNFGFGRPTGIDLPGEVSGLLRPPGIWSKATMTALPMGHEIGVTAIQLACAISAIANGGVYFKPWVVKEIRDNSGAFVRIFYPESLGRVLSETTALQMKELLKGVVEEGTGKKARLKDYTSAGKTGTAQKLRPDGTYSHTKFMASFIGFAPVDNPRVAIVVCIDEPKGVYYGGTVAAPVFKEVAEEVLRYLEITPDKGQMYTPALIAKRQKD